MRGVTFNLPSHCHPEQVAFSKTGNATGDWTFLTVRLSEGTNVQVSIGLTAQSDTESYWLAVDDMRFTDCDTGHLNGPGECDFELDTCGYSDLEARDDFDWTRHQGPTLTYSTGPKTDHTTLTDKGTRNLNRTSINSLILHVETKVMTFPFADLHLIILWNNHK